MGASKYEGSEEFVISPEHKNRTTVERVDKQIIYSLLVNEIILILKISFRHLRKNIRYP